MLWWRGVNVTSVIVIMVFVWGLRIVATLMFGSFFRQFLGMCPNCFMTSIHLSHAICTIPPVILELGLYFKVIVISNWMACLVLNFWWQNVRLLTNNIQIWKNKDGLTQQFARVLFMEKQMAIYAPSMEHVPIIFNTLILFGELAWYLESLIFNRRCKDSCVHFSQLVCLFAGLIAKL